jgi:hypothetical protein
VNYEQIDTFDFISPINFLSLMVTACKPKFGIGPEQTFDVEVPRSETGNITNLMLDLAAPQGKLALAGGPRA